MQKSDYISNKVAILQLSLLSANYSTAILRFVQMAKVFYKLVNESIRFCFILMQCFLTVCLVFLYVSSVFEKYCIFMPVPVFKQKKPLNMYHKPCSEFKELQKIYQDTHTQDVQRKKKPKKTIQSAKYLQSPILLNFIIKFHKFEFSWYTIREKTFKQHHFVSLHLQNFNIRALMQSIILMNRSYN